MKNEGWNGIIWVGSCIQHDCYLRLNKNFDQDVIKYLQEIKYTPTLNEFVQLKKMSDKVFKTFNVPY